MRPLVPFKLFLFGPAILFAIGFLSNAIVMAANGGTMPVLTAGGCTEDAIAGYAEEVDREGMQVHSCMTKATRLKFLADWIVIRHLGVASPGDFFEWAFNLTFKPGLLIWCLLMIIRRPYAQ